jgi:beta-phosphoglucomutase-like phosphatase (HAD superfamily)
MKSVLFDLDGTVANTEILKAKALFISIHSMGGNALAEIYKEVMGQSWKLLPTDSSNAERLNQI